MTSPYQTNPWAHRAGEHQWSLSVSHYGDVDTQAEEPDREAPMTTYDASDITTPKPAVGAAVTYRAGGMLQLGLVTHHPRAFPRLVVVITEDDLLNGGHLADPATLLDPSPADDWDVHVLQALVTVNPTERTPS